MQLKLEALGAEKRQRLMRTQIEAFCEKVKLCEESYSSQLTESVLSQLRLMDGSYIDTVYKLAKYIHEIPEHKQNSPSSAFVMWYLSNIAYMKELKTNFDERIYLPLTKLYQRIDDSDKDISIGKPGSKENTNMSELRAPSVASVLQFKNDLPEVKDLYDFTEVDNVASRLKYLRQRWQLLLDDESEISAALFSYNSQLSPSPQTPTQVLNLLRLVPDILLKSRNAGSLALQWLECSSSKATDLQTKYDKLERVKSILTEKLSGLSEEIKSEERELQVESTDLEMLADREERANEMMSTTQQIDNKIQHLESQISQLNLEINGLRDGKTSSLSDHSTKESVSRQICDSEIAAMKVKRQIRLLLYEKELLEEDLKVELEIKPCMIRFTDQIQEKCENLEQTIDNKRIEKQRVESALVPVIADRNRTQAEISRIGNVESASWK